MTEIIPRREWQTSGQDFGEAETPIRAVAVEMEDTAKVMATVRP